MAKQYSLKKSNMFEVNTLNAFLLFCYFFSLCKLVL